MEGSRVRKVNTYMQYSCVRSEWKISVLKKVIYLPDMGKEGFTREEWRRTMNPSELNHKQGCVLRSAQLAFASSLVVVFTTSSNLSPTKTVRPCQETPRSKIF